MIQAVAQIGLAHSGLDMHQSSTYIWKSGEYGLNQRLCIFERFGAGHGNACRRANRDVGWRALP